MTSTKTSAWGRKYRVFIWLFCLLLVWLPQSLLDKRGRFAWHLASLRVLFWWVVLLIGFFYALSIPVRLVHERMKPKASLQNAI